MSNTDKDALRDFLLSDEVDIDEYHAFMHSVNVGMEGHQSGKLCEGDIEESHEWLREMYRIRVVEGDNE